MDSGRLKALFFISWFVAVGLWSAIVLTNAQVNVTQYHNSSKRDGLYVDSAFTQSAAANLTREMNFEGAIVGNVYAQPLYIEGGPSGPIVIAVTESNNVSALNASPSSLSAKGIAVGNLDDLCKKPLHQNFWCNLFYNDMRYAFNVLW